MKNEVPRDEGDKKKKPKQYCPGNSYQGMHDAMHREYGWLDSSNSCDCTGLCELIVRAGLPPHMSLNAS